MLCRFSRERSNEACARVPSDEFRVDQRDHGPGLMAAGVPPNGQSNLSERYYH
jgi:hypothetical protein